MSTILNPEFIIFVILSAFGLVLNEVIIKVCLDVIYVNWQWLQSFWICRKRVIS